MHIRIPWRNFELSVDFIFLIRVITLNLMELLSGFTVAHQCAILYAFHLTDCFIDWLWRYRIFSCLTRLLSVQSSNVLAITILENELHCPRYNSVVSTQNCCNFTWGTAFWSWFEPAFWLVLFFSYSHPVFEILYRRERYHKLLVGMSALLSAWVAEAWQKSIGYKIKKSKKQMSTITPFNTCLLHIHGILVKIENQMYHISNSSSLITVTDGMDTMSITFGIPSGPHECVSRQGHLASGTVGLAQQSLLVWRPKWSFLVSDVSSKNGICTINRFRSWLLEDKLSLMLRYMRHAWYGSGP